MERTITADDIAQFAGLSGDAYRLHLDAEFAATKRFHEPIAHGMLTAAVASGLLFAGGFIGDDVDALVEAHFKFIAPVFPGDRVSDTTSLVSSRPTREGSIIEHYESVISGPSGGTVLFASWDILRSPESASQKI